MLPTFNCSGVFNINVFVYVSLILLLDSLILILLSKQNVKSIFKKKKAEDIFLLILFLIFTAQNFAFVYIRKFNITTQTQVYAISSCNIKLKY